MKATLLREAVRVAFERHNQHPMYKRGYCLFSFVVERNKLLGMGMNNRDVLIPRHYGYGVREKGWGIGFTACEHSELAAFRKCRGLITGKFELINIRITDGGRVAMSCPCDCCSAWMREQGCIGAHFTTTSGWAKISY